MDEITVEFPGGETVSALVISSELAADLSLLQLARAPHRRVRDILDGVPPGGEFTMTVLRLGKVIEFKGQHP